MKAQDSLESTIPNGVLMNQHSGSGSAFTSQCPRCTYFLLADVKLPKVNSLLPKFYSQENC